MYFITDIITYRIELHFFNNSILLFLRQGSFFYGGHFSSCITRRKLTPGSFFFKINKFFFSWGVIFLRK